MLAEEEALAAVLERARPLPPRRVPLMDALGRILAEPIAADLDLPPFDKALMDGFAVRAEALDGPGPHLLRIGEEILAGGTPSRPLVPGEAATIMTGAPLPSGADAVVMHERTESPGDGSVLIRGEVPSGLAVLKRGREMKAGQVLFAPDCVLDAAKLGVMAAVGRDDVSVRPRPRVVILPTGDELVTIRETPGPGQIRETNSVILAALARSVGADFETLPPARDSSEALERAIAGALALRPDVLLLCGGVSAGKKDLVPAALEAHGVTSVFHKVRLKPGKPLLFGVARPGPADLLVFGLPGNPVSSLVGFLLFVAPALRVLGGMRPPFPLPRREGSLLGSFRHRGDRPTYHPARVVDSSGSGLRLEPLNWAGSADLFTVARSDGFVRFPEGDRDYDEGDRLPFLPLPSFDPSSPS